MTRNQLQMRVGVLVAGAMVAAVAGACKTNVAAPTPGERGGWGEVIGQVELENGAPVSGAEVIVSRCTATIGSEVVSIGLGGISQTGADGTYRVSVALPRAYTPRHNQWAGVSSIDCEVIAQRIDATRHSVSVPIAKDQDDVTPVRVNLVLPD